MTDLTALSDQVQETCVRSGQDIQAFVIVAADGTAEYRSPLPLDELRKLLRLAVEEL